MTDFHTGEKFIHREIRHPSSQYFATESPAGTCRIQATYQPGIIYIFFTSNSTMNPSPPLLQATGGHFRFIDPIPPPPSNVIRVKIFTANYPDTIGILP